MSRHLLFLFLCVLTAVMCFAAAPNQAVAQDKTTGKLQKPAAPDLVVPSAENIVIMIRYTLISLDAAMQTGNFTVLRDLAAPSFREANSAGRLYQVFASLQAQHISLASAAILVPKLPQAPSIQLNGRLHIAGFFPGDPVQINFDLTYEAVSGSWRLFGLAVAPVKPQAADARPTAENGDKPAQPAPEPKPRK